VLWCKQAWLLKNFGFHNLRHSLATFLINKENDINSVRVWISRFKFPRPFDEFFFLILILVRGARCCKYEFKALVMLLWSERPVVRQNLT
jgi:hypothetical protein